MTADLELGPDGVPAGTVRNTLEVPLSGCVLMSGSWAYLLGDLKPGDTVQLRPGEQRDLTHVLRSPGQWNAAAAAEAGVVLSSSNVMKALDQMMFCKAAGAGPTGRLLNGNQEFVDLSDLLELDRAIFVGHASKPAAQLTNAGQAAGRARRSALDGLSICISHQTNHERQEIGSPPARLLHPGVHYS